MAITGTDLITTRTGAKKALNDLLIPEIIPIEMPNKEAIANPIVPLKIVDPAIKIKSLFINKLIVAIKVFHGVGKMKSEL